MTPKITQNLLSDHLFGTNQPAGASLGSLAASLIGNICTQKIRYGW